MSDFNCNNLICYIVSSKPVVPFKRIVRCDKGENVQHVLDKNILALPMEIKLVGECSGFDIK